MHLRSGPTSEFGLVGRVHHPDEGVAHLTKRDAVTLCLVNRGEDDELGQLGMRRVQVDRDALVVSAALTVAVVTPVPESSLGASVSG
jgi:hypothetical protein